MLEICAVSADGDNNRIFTDISFTVPEGKTAALLGPNGCGKTTLLSVISAQKKAESGEVRLSGVPVKKGDSRLSCILQTYGIFPWLDVESNITLPLKIKKTPKQEIRKKAEWALNRFSLKKCRKQFPANLSGGEKQKLAIARTMVTRPELLLMDEPFSAIDTLTREELQDFLRMLLKEEKTSSLIVSHSIEEAVYLADTVFIMGKSPSKGLAAAVDIDTDFYGRRDRKFFSQVNNVRKIMESFR